MDPNAMLAFIRERLQTVRQLRDSTPSAIELATAIDDLDEWLSKGGYLPADWQGRK